MVRSSGVLPIEEVDGEVRYHLSDGEGLALVGRVSEFGLGPGHGVEAVRVLLRTIGLFSLQDKLVRRVGEAKNRGSEEGRWEGPQMHGLGQRS